MTNYWEHTSISTRNGPRSFEVPYVMNNLIDGATLEIGGNDSLFKWALVRRGWPFTLIDPMSPAFNGGRNHKLATCIHNDIRKLQPKDVGTFRNVLLVSVLEHVGLKAYGQPKDWQGSARKEQLKAFQHCMKFVKPGGRMICTLPHTSGPEESDPKFLLRYNAGMLKDLQKGHKLVDESLFILTKPTHLDRWKKVAPKETAGYRSNVCFILEK